VRIDARSGERPGSGAAGFDQRDRVAAVEHRGIEIGNIVNATADVHESLAVFDRASLTFETSNPI
jgi:hypothetical protein